MSQEPSQQLKNDERDQLVPSSSVGAQRNQIKSPTLDHPAPDETPPQKKDHGFPGDRPVIPRVDEASGKRATDPYTQSIPSRTDVNISLGSHSKPKITSDVVCDIGPGRLRNPDQPVIADSQPVSRKVSESQTAAQFTKSVEENSLSSTTTGIQEDQTQITPRHHRRLRGGAKATAMEVAQALGERESTLNVTESSRRPLSTHLTISHPQRLALERPKSNHERHLSGGQVLPSELVLDLIACRSRSSLLDTDSKTMSVEVMSITGTTALTLPQDQAIFHDTEILAIIHRSKSSSTGLVSTAIWGWEGKRATLGEREQRKLQELGNRYGTSIVRPAFNNPHL